MTENELQKLTPEQRKAYPDHVLMGALLTTREGGRDLLVMEGWEPVAVIDGDGDPVTGGEAEVWRRVIGGRTEWCDYCALGPQAGLPPEQCWSRQTYPFDPRLIEY